MSSNNNSGGGLGFTSVLTIVFVVLKLIGVISWSWWWVLSPLWIGLVCWLLLVASICIYYTHDTNKYKKRNSGKWKF